jgi:hypothetical protein
MSWSSFRAPTMMVDTVGRRKRPIKRNLGHGLPGFRTHHIQRIDDPE